jgi:hypothetical protein
MILLLETSDTRNHSCALPCSNFICHGAVNFVDSFNFAGFKWSSFKVRHLPRGPQIVRQSDLFSLKHYASLDKKKRKILFNLIISNMNCNIFLYLEQFRVLSTRKFEVKIEIKSNKTREKSGKRSLCPGILQERFRVPAQNPVPVPVPGPFVFPFLQVDTLFLFLGPGTPFLEM